jgi:hypothetical protein
VSPKNKDTNKQNAKHVYIEEQIHSPNFALAQIQWPPKFCPETSKKFAFFIIERLQVFRGSDHFDLTLLSPLASLPKVLKPTQIK